MPKTITYSKKLFLYLISVTTVMCWSPDSEHALRASLFDESMYHRLVRPRKQTEVDIALNLITISEMDMLAQTLSMVGWLTVEWTDSRLMWNNYTHNVEHIFAMEEEIWKPELFIDNSVSDVSILQGSDLLFKVRNNGKVDWELPRIFQTHCDIDTSYYPYDAQTCSIEITTWTYTKSEVILKHLKPQVNIEDLRANGEWIFLSSTLEEKELTEHTSSGIQIYSMLTFNVILKRRPEFYLTNMILPILLITFLNVAVFYLPADSGEKISYSLTVLLAQAVFLTLIADSLPNTSTSTAIMSIYLTFTLFQGVLCVVFSVIVLKIHFKGEKSPPYWVQKFTHRVLVPGGCYSGRRKKLLSPSSTEEVPLQLPKGEVKMNSHVLQHQEVDKEIDMNEVQEAGYRWLDVAFNLDRFLFVTSLLLTILATIVFILWLKVGGTLQLNSILHQT